MQLHSPSLPRVDMRRATLEEITDLRHQVLRQGLPLSAAIFDGDRDPGSRHDGAFEPVTSPPRAVGCATLHLNHWLDEPAWQLRGMATDPAFRGMGLGRQILAFLEADIRAVQPVVLLWCNARTPAVRFYQKLGWQVVSETFDIPTAGPHVQMVKRL